MKKAELIKKFVIDPEVPQGAKLIMKTEKCGCVNAISNTSDQRDMIRLRIARAFSERLPTKFEGLPEDLTVDHIDVVNEHVLETYGRLAIFFLEVFEDKIEPKRLIHFMVEERKRHIETVRVSLGGPEKCVQ